MSDPGAGTRAGTDGAATGDVGDAVLRVRLVGATPADRDAVRRRLGVGDLSGHGEPDLSVQYTDLPDIVCDARLSPDLGATATELVLGRHGEVRLPLDEPPTRLRVRRGSGCPELLVPLSALAALGNGALPVHGTAVADDGRGTLVTGRSGTGKTAILLEALRRGAGLVAAEHVLLDADGGLTGRDEAVRVRPRHRAVLSGPGLDASRGLAPWLPVTRVSATLANRPGRPGAVGRRLHARVRDRAVYDLPADTFPGATPPVRLETLVVLLPADRVRPEVTPLSPAEAAVHLQALFADEIAPLRHLADAIAHATGRLDRWGLMERQERYRTTAETALAGRRLLIARIPPGELSARAAADLLDQVASR